MRSTTLFKLVPFIPVLLLSGCAWLNPPAPKPTPVIPIQVLAPVPPTFAQSVWKLDNAWHLAVQRTGQIAVRCASYRTVAKAPEMGLARTACWRVLGLRFASEAEWMAKQPIPNYIVGHSTGYVFLREAQQHGARFFSTAADWAKNCSVNFQQCANPVEIHQMRSEKLRTIKDLHRAEATE